MKDFLIELLDIIATHDLGPDHEEPSPEDQGDGGNFNDTYDRGWVNGAHYVAMELKAAIEEATGGTVNAQKGEINVPAI